MNSFFLCLFFYSKNIRNTVFSELNQSFVIIGLSECHLSNYWDGSLNGGLFVELSVSHLINLLSSYFCLAGSSFILSGNVMSPIGRPVPPIRPWQDHRYKSCMYPPTGSGLHILKLQH